MKHEAKILPEWFEALLSGRKSFEVRKDDRDPKYQTGDELFLREFDGVDYTGRTITAEVTFVLRNEYCREGFCILSVIVKDSSPQKPMTQYDRIHSMSIEELAELIVYINDGDLLVDICDAAYCKECVDTEVKCSGNCLNAIIKWLKSEVVF